MKSDKINIYINKLEEYFFNNIIKTLIFFITTEGIIYFGFYFLNKGFFPIIENEYFIQLSIVFFLLGSLIIFAIIYFIFFICEQYVILISNESKNPDIISALIVLISITTLFTIFGYNLFYYSKKSFLDFIFFMIFPLIVVIFLFFRLKIEQTKKIIYLITIVYILTNFFWISKISPLITKMFHLGNYYSKLVIKNKNNICDYLPVNYLKHNQCIIKKTYIVWNMGKFYYIKHNNKIIKIPNNLIINESYYTSK